MSRDWTPSELQAASEAMKAAGHMSYEEFCAQFDAHGFNAEQSEDSAGRVVAGLLSGSAPVSPRDELQPP